MIRSIRFSLTLWYLGILGTILCVFGVVLYSNVAYNLKKDISAVLITEAEGIDDAIFSFWAARREDNDNERSKGEAESEFSQMSDEGLGSLITEWIETADELYTTKPIRFLTPSGEALSFSRAMTKWTLPVNPHAVQRAAAGKLFFETLHIPGQRVRLITRPVFKNHKLIYLIQTAVSLHQADISLKRIRRWLCISIPVTLAVTCVIGWFLASLAMRPVGKMIAQAREIRASQPQKRIDVPRTGDELQQLALTLNELLSRFERGFKRLRQFSAAASHELRTPLTVMQGEVEWVLRKPRIESEYRRVLETQLATLIDMTQVVEQLLAVAHADEGEWAVDWKPVDFSGVVAAACEGYRAIAAQKKIRMQIEIERDVRVKGEKSLLERLVANLLENALKHTRSSGLVGVRLEARDGEAVLCVKDSGPGIAAEELPKIFDKFFTRRAEKNSTGIGLGLCRWIVEAHQGRIEAASPPSQGAVFTVYLPVLTS